MLDSPIPPTDEIRAIRHELAARFDNDLSRIVEDLRRQQRDSGRTYIRLPKRVPRVDSAANHAMYRSGKELD